MDQLASRSDGPCALLVIDVLVVVAELFLDAHFPYCYIIGDAICDATSRRRPTITTVVSWQSPPPPTTAATTMHHQLCAAGLTQVSTPRRAIRTHGAVHVLHEVLFYLSVVILVAFAMELLVLFSIPSQLLPHASLCPRFHRHLHGAGPRDQPQRDDVGGARGSLRLRARVAFRARRTRSLCERA